MKDNLKGHNEQIANIYAARVMAISIIFVVIVQIMNVVGFFKVREDVMYVACGSSIVLLLLPTIILKILKKNEVWLKYVIITCASIFVFCITTTLNYLVFILFVFPMALASIYFEPILNLYTLAMTVVVTSVGRMIAFHLQVNPDKNFIKWNSLILYSIFPTLFMLVTLGIIFHALAQNTNCIMGSLMDAEEQEKVFLRVKKLSEKSSEVSVGLSDGMKTLSEVTHNTVVVNEEITNNTIRVVEGIQSTVNQLSVAEDNSVQIYENIKELADESDKITQLFENIEMMSNENKYFMQQVTIGMNKMKESNDVCQDAMERLKEKTKRIDNIVNVIADISDQTDLLSLNAAIESARAGEQGKGFAVVSEEIRKLSQQTQKTLNDVREIIGEVLEQNEIAVEAMNDTAEVFEEQKENIGKAEKSAQGVLTATNEMSGKIQSISSNTKHIEKNTSEIVTIVNEVSNICRDSQGSLDEVSASVETGLSSMKQLEEVVGSIQNMSDELAQVVQS